MKFYHILLALLAGSWCAHSQNTISGKVLTTQQQPLDGAHIHIGQLHGVSSPDGYYEVHGLSDGRHRVVISYIGYKSLDTLVDVTGNVTLDAVLKPEATVLQEVVVTEIAVPKNTTHEQRLRTETIERYSNASLGDALREIAGVSSLRSGSTIVKPVINGLHSSRVPVIANNVRLEDQQWGMEHAPNLDINAAGKVSVIKGASALQYGGDAIGGLVLVEPLQVLKDTLFGRSILTLDSNGRGGTLASSLHKGAEKGWAWNANGTVKYMGDREAPDYVLSNTGNREGNFSGDIKYLADTFDASLNYSFYNAKIGIAKATHTGSTADLVRAINSGEPSIVEPFTYDISVPRQEVQHHVAKANFNKNWVDGSTLSLQYAFQLNKRKEFDLRRGAYEDTPALDLTLVTHSVNADWKKETNSNTFKAGMSAAMQDNEASADTGVRPLIPNYNRYDAGAYGIISRRFTESLSGEAGVRYDFSHIEAQKYYQKTRWDDLGYNGVFDHFIVQDYGTQWFTRPEFTFHNISASLGIRKRFNSQFELLGNAGLAMRNPNPSELFSDGLHHSNATIELGNLRMQKEEAYKFSATLLKSGDRFSFEVTPYLNIINNFIYLEPTGEESTIRGTFPVFNYRQCDAILAGADLQTTWNISNSFSHVFNAAYVHGTNTTDDEPLIDMPPLNITNTIRYTKRDWHSFFAEIRSEAVFRQGRYPHNNFMADVPQNGEFVPVWVDISTPPPGYHLLHFTSGVKFTLGRTLASVNLSVNNIFNTSYRDYLNRQRFYVDEPGRNFQLQLKFNY
jgi:iron complex outermembrane receptor protein